MVHEWDPDQHPGLGWPTVYRKLRRLQYFEFCQESVPYLAMDVTDDNAWHRHFQQCAFFLKDALDTVDKGE